jgi:hypothetical protein
MVYLYRLTSESSDLLKDAATGLYAWQEPDLPEDLHLLRADGTTWLGSVAHHRDGWLEVDGEEYRQVMESIPELVLARTDLPGDERDLFLQAAKQQGTTEPEFLLPKWAHVVSQCSDEFGYPLNWYWHALDARIAIQGILDGVPVRALTKLRAAVTEIDREFRRGTVALAHPVWTESLAKAQPDKYFFLFRLPRRPGDLIDELADLGLRDELQNALSGQASSDD